MVGEGLTRAQMRKRGNQNKELKKKKLVGRTRPKRNTGKTPVKAEGGEIGGFFVLQKAWGVFTARVTPRRGETKRKGVLGKKKKLFE